MTPTPLLLAQLGTWTILTWLSSGFGTPSEPVAVMNTILDRLKLILRQRLPKARPRLGLSILSSVVDGLLWKLTDTPLTLLSTIRVPCELVPMRPRTTCFGTELTQAWWRLWTLVLLCMLFRVTWTNPCLAVPVTDRLSEAPLMLGGLMRYRTGFPNRRMCRRIVRHLRTCRPILLRLQRLVLSMRLVLLRLRWTLACVRYGIRIS